MEQHVSIEWAAALSGSITKMCETRMCVRCTRDVYKVKHICLSIESRLMNCVTFVYTKYTVKENKHINIIL